MLHPISGDLLPYLSEGGLFTISRGNHAPKRGMVDDFSYPVSVQRPPNLVFSLFMVGQREKFFYLWVPSLVPVYHISRFPSQLANKPWHCHLQEKRSRNAVKAKTCERRISLQPRWVVIWAQDRKLTNKFSKWGRWFPYLTRFPSCLLVGDCQCDSNFVGSSRNGQACSAGQWRDSDQQRWCHNSK